jgi:hypothetical protein
MRERFKQQVPHPPGKAAGFGMTRRLVVMMNVVDWWKSREVVLLALDGRQGCRVAQRGNVGKVAGVRLVVVVRRMRLGEKK